jgi:hypothetical protein
MNKSFVVRPLSFLFMASIIMTACNNNKEKETETPAANTTAQEPSTPAPASTESPAEKAVVNFFVNDTAAVTKKGNTNDTDPQLGLYTEASKSLSFDLMGDVPQRPHRGWLHFGIKNFKFEPASYTQSADNFAMFTRYETANAGGSSDFACDANPVNNGTEFSVNFTKIEKDPSQPRTYLASGTFTAKMYNKVYSLKRDSKTEVKISNGSFENVPIMGGPAN